MSSDFFHIFPIFFYSFILGVPAPFTDAGVVSALWVSFSHDSKAGIEADANGRMLKLIATPRGGRHIVLNDILAAVITNGDCCDSKGGQEYQVRDSFGDLQQRLCPDGGHENKCNPTTDGNFPDRSVLTNARNGSLKGTDHIGVILLIHGSLDISTDANVISSTTTVMDRLCLEFEAAGVMMQPLIRPAANPAPHVEFKHRRYKFVFL